MMMMNTKAMINHLEDSFGDITVLLGHITDMDHPCTQDIKNLTKGLNHLSLTIERLYDMEDKLEAKACWTKEKSMEHKA